MHFVFLDSLLFTTHQMVLLCTYLNTVGCNSLRFISNFSPLFVFSPLGFTYSPKCYVIIRTPDNVVIMAREEMGREKWERWLVIRKEAEII